MKTEYEARVLEIDKDAMIAKIEKLGGKFVGRYEQKRYVYDFNPVVPNKWIRLRTDGKTTTLAIKEVRSEQVDGTQELEVEVSDFEGTNQILNELGYTAKGFQENRRTRYMLNGVELDLDEWPMIPAYIEVEGESAEAVNSIIDLLEADKAKVTSKDVQGIYLDVYGIDLKIVKNLSF